MRGWGMRMALRRWWGAGAFALVADCGIAVEEARGQIVLPEITVTTPTPVAPTRPAAPRPQAKAAPNTPLQPPDGISLCMPADPGFAAVTVMTPTETLSIGSPSLGDQLSTRPGIAATAFAPQASRPVIRGLGGFRVRTQENGVSTHDMANL